MNSRRPSRPPKTQLLAASRQEDPAELGASVVEDMDPVACGGPDVAVDVDAQAVRQPRLHDHEGPRVGQPSTAVDDVEGQDVVVATGIRAADVSDT